MLFTIKRYRFDESGATAIEYGLLAAMLTVVLVSIFATGEATQALYDALLAIADAMAGASGSGGGGT
jgi:Flp pilus assembly pilin Flp